MYQVVAGLRMEVKNHESTILTLNQQLVHLSAHLQASPLRDNLFKNTSASLASSPNGHASITVLPSGTPNGDGMGGPKRKPMIGRRKKTSDAMSDHSNGTS